MRDIALYAALVMLAALTIAVQYCQPLPQRRLVLWRWCLAVAFLALLVNTAALVFWLVWAAARHLGIST